MLCSKIKTPCYPLAAMIALIFFLIGIQKLYPSSDLGRQFGDRNAPAGERSDTTVRRTNYNWFLRKQFMPVNYKWLSIGIDEGIINNSSISNFTQFSLSSGRYIDMSNFIQLSGAYGWMFLKESSDLKSEIEGSIKLYNISLEFKSFLPSYLPGITQYFLFGFGMDWFSYKLKNPVELGYVDPSFWGTITEQAEEDYFTALDLHIGLGLSLADTGMCQVYTEISPGFIWPAKETYLGFENSLLKKAFYINLKMSIYFAYGEL